jgi:hypothetical protein
VPLRVVADVDERLSGVLGDTDAVEELARARALLVDPDGTLAAMGVAHGVGAALGDPGQERLRGERPVDARGRAQAIAGDPAHGFLDVSAVLRVR